MRLGWCWVLLHSDLIMRDLAVGRNGGFAIRRSDESAVAF